MKKIVKLLLGESTFFLIKSYFKSAEEKLLIKKRGQFYSNFLTSDNDIYFDVGANYGNRIEPIIDKKIKIVAIEPQPQCVKFLKRKYNQRITLIPKGLGANKGTQKMYISNASTLSSFSKDWIDATQESGRFSQYKWDKESIVEMTTLDTLIEKHGKPKFVKIDVEGFELDVLKWLSQPVEFISFEYAMPEAKQSILLCIDKIVSISGDNEVKFNYSIGESMEWALDTWLSPKEMKEEVEQDRFLLSEFGDVYSNCTIK